MSGVDHRAYVARETAISIAINGVLSLGFALATFGRAEQVPV